MNNKMILRGIALLLFGILLCLAGEQLNWLFFHSIGYLPFSFFGTILGIVGLILAFVPEK